MNSRDADAPMVDHPAWLWIGEARMQVEDRGGGTLVNGHQIRERVQLEYLARGYRGTGKWLPAIGSTTKPPHPLPLSNVACRSTRPPHINNTRSPSFSLMPLGGLVRAGPLHWANSVQAQIRIIGLH